MYSLCLHIHRSARQGTQQRKRTTELHRLAPFIGQLHPEGANQPLDQELAAEANSGWSPENKGREGGERKQEEKHNTHILGSCLARNKSEPADQTPTLSPPTHWTCYKHHIASWHFWHASLQRVQSKRFQRLWMVVHLETLYPGVDQPSAVVQE